MEIPEISRWRGILFVAWATFAAVILVKGWDSAIIRVINILLFASFIFASYQEHDWGKRLEKSSTPGLKILLFVNIVLSVVAIPAFYLIFVKKTDAAAIFAVLFSEFLLATITIRAVLELKKRARTEEET